MKLRSVVLRDTGFWPLADQAIVSLGSFLTHITLARVLPVVDYGTFAFLLEVVFFLNGVHGALVTYPLSVKGAAADAAGLRSVTTAALLATLFLAVPLGAAMAGAALLLGERELIVVAPTALVLWMIQETLRRALMAHLRHDVAMWGDGLSYLGQACLIWVFSRRLSLDTVFFLMALTSAIAATLQAVQLGLARPTLRSVSETIRSFLVLGRWALLATLTSVLTVHAFPWCIAFFHGVGTLAGYQSLSNVIRVSHPVMIGTGSILVPAVARARVDGGLREAWRVTQRYAVQGGLLIFSYFGLLIVFPKAILDLLYGPQSPYVAFDGVLRVYAVGYAVLYVTEVASALLKGLEESRSAFFAQTCQAITALGVGVPLIASFGVLGATWGGLVAVTARLAATGFFLRQVRLADAATR